MKMLFVFLLTTLVVIGGADPLTGCPSLATYQPDPTVESNDAPTCFCDVAQVETSAFSDRVPISIACVYGSNRTDVTDALNSAAKNASTYVSELFLNDWDSDHMGPLNKNFFQGVPIERLVIENCLPSLQVADDAFDTVKDVLKRLTIKNCRLEPPRIPRGAKQLLELQLINTGIDDLGQSNFSEVPNLVKLNLSQNSISTIEQGTFVPLTNLTNLDLSQNKYINSSSLPAINAVPSLKVLNLSVNSIAELGTNAFSALGGNLQTLNLVRNNLETILPATFQGLDQLSSLDLRQNLIDQVANGSFAGLSNLRMLDLGSNYIAQLAPEIFSGLGSLQQLGLSNNDMASLGAQLFNNVPKLKELDLGNNLKLTNIDPSAFSSLSSLQNLFLNKVKQLNLSSPLFTNLTTLSKLVLTDSSIAQMSSNAFQGLGKLKSLLMPNTNLSTLPSGVMNPLKSVSQLDLSQNPLDCSGSGIEAMASWFSKMTNRSSINLVNAGETVCNMLGSAQPLLTTFENFLMGRSALAPSGVGSLFEALFDNVAQKFDQLQTGGDAAQFVKNLANQLG